MTSVYSENIYLYLYMYHIILSSEDEVVDADILFYVWFVSSLTFSLLSKYLSISMSTKIPTYVRAIEDPRS